MASSETITGLVCSRFPSAVVESTEVQGVSTLQIKADALTDICAFVKSDPELRFDYLMSLSAIDWRDRIEAVYHLYSVDLKHYLTLKVKLSRENPVIASVVQVWLAADWQEREAYDMFGIEFKGHPNLQRILLEPDWEGFPLRKDYVQK